MSDMVSGVVGRKFPSAQLGSTLNTSDHRSCTKSSWNL